MRVAYTSQSISVVEIQTGLVVLGMIRVHDIDYRRIQNW